eukprot:Opistho-2@17470
MAEPYGPIETVDVTDADVEDALPNAATVHIGEGPVCDLGRDGNGDGPRAPHGAHDAGDGASEGVDGHVPRTPAAAHALYHGKPRTPAQLVDRSHSASIDSLFRQAILPHHVSASDPHSPLKRSTSTSLSRSSSGVELHRIRSDARISSPQPLQQHPQQQQQGDQRQSKTATGQGSIAGLNLSTTRLSQLEDTVGSIAGSHDGEPSRRRTALLARLFNPRRESTMNFR